MRLTLSCASTWIPSLFRYARNLGGAGRTVFPVPKTMISAVNQDGQRVSGPEHNPD
jgi:hypothetical protein